jgi:hypothetical protein
MKTHYDTLEVTESASAETITTAYKHLMQKCDHRSSSDTPVASQVARLNEAYEVLGNEQSKVAYDLFLYTLRLNKQAAAPRADRVDGNFLEIHCREEALLKKESELKELQKAIVDRDRLQQEAEIKRKAIESVRKPANLTDKAQNEIALVSAKSAPAGTSSLQSKAAPVEFWNPNAAGLWSFSLSPVFGAYLCRKNWLNLGREDMANRSRNWMIGYLFVVVANLFLPDAIKPIYQLATLGFIGAWYALDAEAQKKVLIDQFGADYPKVAKTRWIAPVLLGYFSLLVAIVLLFALSRI